MSSISSNKPITVGALVLQGLDGYLFTTQSGYLAQTAGYGLFNEVFYDNVGGSPTFTLFCGSGASLLAGTGNLSAVHATSYPGINIGNGNGLFGSWSTGVDAEILNAWVDDYLYIGPYFNYTGDTTGTIVIYRSGAGNEGDGTWFANGALGEVTFNGPFANVTAGTNACFLINGLSNTPSKKVLEVHSQGAGTIVQRLTTEATNDNPTEDVIQNRLATTGGSFTSIHTFTIPSSTTLAIDAMLVIRRTGGVAGTAEDGGRIEVKAVFKNVAGTATQIGSTTTLQDTSAAYAIKFTISTNTIALQCAGIANTNLTWHMTARTYQVST